MESIARSITLAGLVVFLIGAGTFLAAKFKLPLGRLPGDIRIEGENGTFHFPLASSIVISVVLGYHVNLTIRILTS